jgi:hypothetical protein
MSNTPPPEVAAAAAVVQRWLDNAPPVVKSAEEVAKMTPAERLDYARQFPQHLPSGKWSKPR